MFAAVSASAAVVVADSVVVTTVVSPAVISVLVFMPLDADVISLTDVVADDGLTLPDSKLLTRLNVDNCGKEEFSDASVGCADVSSFSVVADAITIKHNP